MRLVLDDGAVQLGLLRLNHRGLGLDELKGIEGEACAPAPILELLEVGGGGLGRLGFGSSPLECLLNQAILVLLDVRAVQEFLDGLTAVDGIDWGCTTQRPGRAWLDRGHGSELT